MEATMSEPVQHTPLPAEEQEVVLAARHYLYVLFQNLLGNEPSPEQLAAIDAFITRDALAIMEEDATQPSSNPPASVDAAFLDDLETYRDDPAPLKSEYTRLFLGPNKLVAPPWESVYIGKERTLFTVVTLNVREFYRSQGFLPAEYPHVADDHIALELDFLANVGNKAIEALAAGDNDAVRNRLEASAKFLDDHLLKWVGDYEKDLVEKGKSIFYVKVVQAAVAFARQDRQLLDRLLA
jgi:TorA maturation chaperone TorD